jgi:hypothetical protein
MFSISAATMQNIFVQDPNFGGGTCGATPADIDTFTECGAYQIVLTPSVPVVAFTDLESPIPSGMGAWDVGTGGGEVYFYADYTTSGDQYITFLTGNSSVGGNTFSLTEATSPYSLVSVTGTGAMPASDMFSFTLDTSADGVTGNNITWSIGVELVSLNTNGSQGLKNSFYTETGVVLSPEPSGAWLFLTGIAALGLRKKWR